jgi:hypothetical protein
MLSAQCIRSDLNTIALHTSWIGCEHGPGELATIAQASERWCRHGGQCSYEIGTNGDVTSQQIFINGLSVNMFDSEY